MINIILLSLFILSISLSLGGGIYETLVIYPNWKHATGPAELLQKLQSSGQLNANKRFWPMVSPGQTLLAIVNIVLASRFTGQAHCVWLGASIIIASNRLITFGYFIPVMIRKIMQPEKIEVARLQRIVKWWTTLSPLRLIADIASWGLALWALMLLTTGR